MSSVILHPNQLTEHTLTLEERPIETGVLLASPQHFEVRYVINPHMKDNIGTVDQGLAMSQWKALKSTYGSLGYSVSVIPPVRDLPDLVFAANQSFPYISKSGERSAIISRMHSVYRQPEVDYYAKWYTDNNFRVIRQNDPPVDFEGAGDVQWHPDKRLLYIGYGFRTDKSALHRASELIQCPVVGLELIDSRFYHLDTALCPLDEHTAIVVEEAFTDDGLNLIKTQFPRLISAPIAEALNFVANGHCPDRKNFIVQAGNPHTLNIVQEMGFNIIELETSEFMKSGGSVFCMKMMLP